MKTCEACGVEMEERGRFCELHHEIYREIKRRASLEVRQAVKSGKLSPPSGKCSDCHNPATVYDHRYYSQPLKVEAVCVPCNNRRRSAIDLVVLVRSFADVEKTRERISRRQAVRSRLYQGLIDPPVTKKAVTSQETRLKYA